MNKPKRLSNIKTAHFTFNIQSDLNIQNVKKDWMVILNSNIIKTFKWQRRKINFSVSFGVSELRKDRLEGWFKLLTQGEDSATHINQTNALQKKSVLHAKVSKHH